MDIQGFGRFADKFVVKELAAMSIKTPMECESSLTRVLFKSPCSWVTLSREYRNLNTWLTQNYHGIPWTAGDTPYKDVGKVLKEIVEDASYILVKGKDKQQWVEKIIDDESKAVIDLDALDCPSLRILRRNSSAIRWHGDCHGSVIGYKCAFENVQRLNGWYSKECIGSMGKALRIYAQVGGLKRMRAEDISYLDSQFILFHESHSIDEVWDKLSPSMKNDEKIANCRRCRLHHDEDNDLPGHMIKQCPYIANNGCYSSEHKSMHIES